MDEGFVQVCQLRAQELQQSGQDDQAQFLRDVAKQVGAFLNQQPSASPGKSRRTIGDLRPDTTLMDLNFSMKALPKSWEDITPGLIYTTPNKMRVSFGQKQINQGKRYDARKPKKDPDAEEKEAKHITAIKKGRVAPRSNIGLVPSEVEGYDLKSKVLGQGGDRRFHGKFIDGVLHFPGYTTTEHH